MTKQADLTAYVFEGQPHLLSAALMEWMEASARFTAFVETYRDKIRKKVRVTRDLESVLDLRSELEIAYCLLTDRRLALTYEPYASQKRRGPDFAVTYRANLVFNIEVARLRGEESDARESGAAQESGMEGDDPPQGINLLQGVDLARKEERVFTEERIVRILLYKLGQMQPGMPNLLLIHTREELARAIDLGRLMQELKTRVEGKDPAFYALTRYTGPAAFYKDFHHLSGILLWADGAQLWSNKQARPGLEEKVMRQVSHALQARSLASGASPG